MSSYFENLKLVSRLAFFPTLNHIGSNVSAPCLQPCCTGEVDMVAQHIVEENMNNNTVLEIHFPPTIKVYKEMYLYELINMIAGDFF